nr:1613_t:CDS:2 [Entrophospora candida]
MEIQVVDREQINPSIEESTITQLNPQSDQQQSVEIDLNKADGNSNNAELHDISKQFTNANANNQHETFSMGITQKKKRKKRKKKKQVDSLTEDLLFVDPGEKEPDDDDRYNSSILISLRIEVATQRFKDTRRVSSTRNQVLSSYLNFGEVKIGQNPDTASKKSADFIQEELIVDFTYVVKAYLSSYIMDQSGYYTLEHFYEAPIVVSSFLNYLVRHDVCPEHLEDILRAIEIADRAKVELPNCKSFILTAFNKFNKACSILYGGGLYGVFDNPWNLKSTMECMKISLSEAKEIINITFGENALENIKHVEAATKKALQVEIINIEKSPEKYLRNGKKEDSTSSTSSTDKEQSDTSDSLDDDKTNKTDDDTGLYKMTVRTCKEPTVESFDVHIEFEALQYAMVGMFIIADFHQLSNGWWYYDTMTNVYPSYYEMCEDSDDDE